MDQHFTLGSSQCYPEGSTERREYDSLNLTNEDFALKYYGNYPEGSGSRKLYDYYSMDIQDYLIKYQTTFDLSNWSSFLTKYVEPLFDGSSIDIYYQYIEKVQAPFRPDHRVVEKNKLYLETHNEFDQELEKFFAFLLSTQFFETYNISFEDWISSPNWDRSNAKDGHTESISELLNYKYGIKLLKVLLREMPWLN